MDDLKVPIRNAITFGDKKGFYGLTPETCYQQSQKKHHTEKLKHRLIPGLDLNITAALANI